MTTTLLRARPLLGTFVRVQVSARSPGEAERAVSAAFAATSRIHEAMSFHEPNSQLSTLNRAAPGKWTRVAAGMGEVLALALSVAQASAGAFDPVVAGRRAVEQGALPAPDGRTPDPRADWRDLRLSADRSHVRLEKAVWIDLGGIAKGWAVDAAVNALRSAEVSAGWVEAGGDIRAFGEPIPVLLDARAPSAPVAELTLADAALAASGSLQPGRNLAAQAHVDGRDGAAIAGCFAAVTALECAVADALTKVVLALGTESAPVLDRFGAQGYHLAPGRAWSVLGASPA